MVHGGSDPRAIMKPELMMSMSNMKPETALATAIFWNTAPTRRKIDVIASDAVMRMRYAMKKYLGLSAWTHTGREGSASRVSFYDKNHLVFCSLWDEMEGTLRS
jgi:hypothetical protein